MVFIQHFMLDVNGGYTADGTNILIYHGYGGIAQQYFCRASSEIGSYGIMTNVTNGSSCLHLSVADNRNVIENAYWSGTNQLWTFEAIK